MKKYEEFIILSDNEKEELDHIYELISSTDKDTMVLGVTLLKSSKFWKRIKPKTLWIPVGASTRSYKNVTTLEEAKRACLNVVYWLSREGDDYFYHTYQDFFERLHNKSPFYRLV